MINFALHGPEYIFLFYFNLSFVFLTKFEQFLYFIASQFIIFQGSYHMSVDVAILPAFLQSSIFINLCDELCSTDNKSHLSTKILLYQNIAISALV